jgi:hypothetical protein
MSTFTILDFDGIVEQFAGRGVVFGRPYWDGSEPIEGSGASALVHLADTEGKIVLTPNETYGHIRMDEQRGGAKLRTWVKGQEPSIALPVFLADPAAREFFTPRGTASAGFKRWRPPLYKTLVLAPEDLMWDEVTGTYRDLVHTGNGVFTIGGSAPTTRQELMIEKIVYLWKCYSESAPLSFGTEQDGREMETVTLQVCPDLSKPDGHELYTWGRDLASSTIDIEGGS